MARAKKGKVWLVAVDMGYGHQRALFPLLDLAEDGRVLTANNYEGIPADDRAAWLRIERAYNFISRLKGKGRLGAWAFALFDRFQRIRPFYPARSEEDPSFQLLAVSRRIRKGWGRHLIEKLLQDPLPLLTSHFIVAHMAEQWNYPAPVCLVVTDSDVSRAWAPLEPKGSKILYLAPTDRVAARLERYGVGRERILTTGFPLPEELIGSRDGQAKECLLRRMARLDPLSRYRNRAAGLVRQHFGPAASKRTGKQGPVILTFAIGGAGAQAEIAHNLLSLAELITRGKVALRLTAGVSPRAARTFEKAVSRAGLQSQLGSGITVALARTKEEHFAAFNRILAETDVLWTKPSELSFYAALGIPLIVAPPVGSHEERNREWLLELGAGIDQLDPLSAGEWFPDLLAAGRFAEAAVDGFLKMDRRGTSRVREIVTHLFV